MFSEMYPKSSLSELQVEGYKMALGDLTAAELEMGCKRVLRTWTYSGMPPPGFIRTCVADEMREQISKRPISREAPPERLTEAESLQLLDEMKVAGEKLRGVLAKVAGSMHKDLTRVYRQHLVIATRERIAELNEQKKIIEAKYGKGKVVRVRDSAPPETDQGTSGEK